jgi:hypothetical protein
VRIDNGDVGEQIGGEVAGVGGGGVFGARAVELVAKFGHYVFVPGRRRAMKGSPMIPSYWRGRTHSGPPSSARGAVPHSQGGRSSDGARPAFTSDDVILSVSEGSGFEVRGPDASLRSA